MPNSVTEKTRRAFLGTALGTSGVLLSQGLISSCTSSLSKHNAVTGGGLIDVHCHTYLPSWTRALRKFGQPIYPLAGMSEWTAEHVLAIMDNHGIEKAVLSSTAPLDFAGDEAPLLARELNEAHAELKQRHPNRFLAFGVVPLPNIDATLTETQYALDELELDGICTSTQINGVYLGNPILNPWYEDLDHRRAVLFAHPGMPQQFPNLNMPISMIEFMFETVRMLANMVFSGTKKRYPNIEIISTHGGGAIPYLNQRIGWLAEQFGLYYWQEETPTPEEVNTLLASFHYDLTAATSPAQLNAMLDLVPPSRLMIGFDVPFMSERYIDPMLNQLATNPRLTSMDVADIRSHNAARLFNLPA